MRGGRVAVMMDNVESFVSATERLLLLVLESHSWLSKALVQTVISPAFD